MATIKAIEARTVHQIQSGQVIVDLCSVVKELVENGLDAGATSIEVRFKNQGLDSIEVQDNGSGISRENYETIALKHYTSKLSTYSDLSSLQTFGFRGEALSSLCALSKFTITTCLASDAPKGSKLEFETSGKLLSTTVVAAQKGTTVTIEGLFHNLPVRRRELERNIKREWNKVIGVLNQYACIKTGLKFSVSQQPTKGKRIVLFSTKGNQTTRENIVNVFGAKTLAVLIPLDLKLELEPTNAPGQKWTTQSDDSIQEILIKGHVSRPAHGEGRQTPDRQMFFVNGRPCGLPQFAKVFNEVYKSYNASQSPFIFADIQLDTHLYDVNVSPDKRTILLHDQTRMLDNLRESLVALFESQDYALPTSQLSSIKSTPFKKPSLSRHNTPFSQSGSVPSTSADNSQRQSSASTVPSNTIGNDEDEDEEPADEAISSSSASRRTAAHDGKSLNLVSRWAERRSASRADTPSTTSKISEDHDQETSKGTQHTFARFARDNTKEDKDAELEDSAQDLPASTIPSTEASSEKPDFRARLAELSRSKADRRSSSPPVEPPIPAVSTSSRVSDIKSSRVSSSAGLKRSTPEVATITVGNHTVTSIIGSPSKRQRIDDNKNRDSSVRQRVIKESVTIPTFNGRLTQMFAAYSQSKQAGSSRIETTTKKTDGSEDSDASSEHLFVEGSDDEGDEQDDEQEDGRDEEDAASVQSKEDEDIPEEVDHDSDYQPPESKAVDIELQDDTPPSPVQPTDDEHLNNQTEELPEVKVDGDAGATQEPTKSTSEETQRRTQTFIKGGTKKKDSTISLLQTLRTNENQILNSLKVHQDYMKDVSLTTSSKLVTDKLDAEDAEEKLSLTISKSDFGKMRIIGQFNLGFILAVRPANADHNDAEVKGDRDDELFIIDQHATDEKYNFERLQANTVVQSQRLVQPKTLELTALEEEVIRENIPALEANGFIVSMDESGDQPVGSRCQLLSLPLSRETTFSLADLEELVSMLTDHQSVSASAIPRPSKVRKMFAMRACRSSVMIGKHLTTPQMQKLVRHMGELDKPWNCPHGRPTMRHLCGIGAWSEMGWREGDGFEGERSPRTDWGTYVREKNGLE
ncbi:DNA mismatch repair protein MutL [Annulohypoxylon truncatum]|uniref:DNA mismatch repair protein MutL n=1 Tax=Annulohypoxylon truncatum TaxID=327061 RepID=UPI0020077FBE|nr:DNA mismatch repair protein MutL [Annulohypoxylon truncatum]KAI1205765.1 DNA mismatch repair protein MutL [Annulohypoxylon truncatum]